MITYLGLLRFKVVFDEDNKKIEIPDEMTQLVMASNKDNARVALLEYWEKENNGAILIEARINDTIIGK